MKLLRTTLVVCVATAFTGAAFGGPINIVSYASVGPNTSNFEDVTGSPFPGTVYNGVLTSGGVRYAERFAGQTLGFSGNNDVLSGAPSNPLTLQLGAANQNLDVGTDNGTPQESAGNKIVGAVVSADIQILIRSAQLQRQGI